MICQYCKSGLEHDERIIVIDGKLLHEMECFTDYMIENYADASDLTYIEHLENLVMGDE